MKTKHLLIGIMGAALLGLGLGGIAQKTEAAEESAQKTLESSMGKMFLSEWTRVTSADQLKQCTEATPMRLYATLGDKTYLVYDTTKKDGNTLTVSPLSNVNAAIKNNENYAELTAIKPEDTGYIQYTGKTDDDNDDSPMCYISLNSDNDKFLGTDSDRKLHTYADSKTAWTVLLKQNEDDNKNYVSFFVNVSYYQDPALWFKSDTDKKGLLYSDTSGSNSDYTEYALYIGDITDITVIQNDVTVGAGQTVRISSSGGIALQDGCSLNIQEGGAALLESKFLNQGTINNKGTLVVMDEGCLQPVYDTGGTLNCDGGDLLIMEGGRFMSGEALTAKKGATILNQGIFLAGKDVTLNDASLITEPSGTTLLGYTISSDDFRDAKVNTISDSCISGKSSLPSLAGASLGDISSSKLTIESNGRLVNRGTTVIHQKISGAGKITTENEKAYYNNK